ncbi:MAG: hypothetical protein U0670_21885 [Anaerolineae bacterium]
MPDFGQTDPGPQSIFENQSTYWWEGGKKVESSEEFTARKLSTDLDKISRQQAGRRSRTKTDRKRGRYIMARPANGDYRDIAFDATFRAAAPSKNSAVSRKPVPAWPTPSAAATCKRKSACARRPT